MPPLSDDSSLVGLMNFCVSSFQSKIKLGKKNIVMNWNCQSTNCVPRLLEMSKMESGWQQLGLLHHIICSGLF